MKLKREKGQSIIEFAYTFPIFFVVSLAALQLAGYGYQRHILYQAANKGARVAVTTMSSDIRSDVEVKVREAMEPYRQQLRMELDNVEVCIPQGDGGTSGIDKNEPVRVILTAETKFLVTKVLPEKFGRMSIRATAFSNYHDIPQGVSTVPGEGSCHG